MRDCHRTMMSISSCSSSLPLTRVSWVVRKPPGSSWNLLCTQVNLFRSEKVLNISLPSTAPGGSGSRIFRSDAKVFVHPHVVTFFAAVAAPTESCSLLPPTSFSLNFKPTKQFDLSRCRFRCVNCALFFHHVPVAS